MTIRDVLATFRTQEDGTVEYTLLAVLPRHGATQQAIDTVREWLGEIVLEVPASLGLAVGVDAYSDDRLSLAYLEASYGLSVSTLSWPPTVPGPVGEV